jgi:hypothetical protein
MSVLACAGRWHFLPLALTWAQGKKKAARLSGFVCVLALASVRVVAPAAEPPHGVDHHCLPIVIRWH